MNTTTPTIQPPQPRQFSPGGCVIGVHIGSTYPLLIETVLQDSFIAMATLRRLLTVALQHADLLDSKVVSTGRMDDMVIMVAVTDGPAAVEIIKAELAASMLLSFAKIAIGEAGQWCCVYPSPHVRMASLLDTERHEFHDAQRLQAMLDLIRQLAEFMRLALNHPDLTVEQRAEFTAALQAAEQQDAELEKQIASLTRPETE